LKSLALGRDENPAVCLRKRRHGHIAGGYGGGKAVFAAHCNELRESGDGGYFAREPCRAPAWRLGAHRKASQQCPAEHVPGGKRAIEPSRQQQNRPGSDHCESSRFRGDEADTVRHNLADSSRRHRAVVAATARAAHDDHGLRIRLRQRAVELFVRIADRCRATLAGDGVRDPCDRGIDHPIAARAPSGNAQTRSADRHALDVQGRKQRDAQRRKPPACWNENSAAGCIRARKQDALSRRDRRNRLRLPLTNDHRIERRDCIGTGWQQLAHVDANGGRHRRRSIGTGIRGQIGRDRPSIAKRKRRTWDRPIDDDIVGDEASSRSRKLHGTHLDRLDVRIDAREHVAKRREPGGSLRRFAILDHGNVQERMTDKTINLRGLKCPLPALRARKALAALKPGDLLIAECTDPLSAVDIPNLINQTGDRLEASSREGNVLVFRIRKR
jgi:tRNA 2-thiouridine synthesizing protein A